MPCQSRWRFHPSRSPARLTAWTASASRLPLHREAGVADHERSAALFRRAPAPVLTCGRADVVSCDAVIVLLIVTLPECARRVDLI